MGFLDEFKKVVEKTADGLEQDYSNTMREIQYMDIYQLCQRCPKSTMAGVGRIKAFQEQMEDWVVNHIDDKEEIRKVLRFCEEKRYQVAARLIRTYYQRNT